VLYDKFIKEEIMNETDGGARRRVREIEDFILAADQEMLKHLQAFIEIRANQINNTIDEDSNALSAWKGRTW